MESKDRKKKKCNDVFEMENDGVLKMESKK